MTAGGLASLVTAGGLASLVSAGGVPLLLAELLLGLALGAVPLLKTSWQVSVTMDTAPSSRTIAVK